MFGQPYDLIFFFNVGAAGNFLAPISGMSENAFKTVMEIDTVNFHYLKVSHREFTLFTDWFI
jgi:hypothetical protein